MARGAVMSATPSACRIQTLALLLVACFAGHAYGSCLQYGHSCWGAHGKRSGGQTSGDVPGDGLLGPVAPASSSSSPSSPDSEALWVLSKLMATKELDRKDGEGSAADAKDSSIWQRILDAKKNNKPLESQQQSGNSQSQSNFDHAELQNVDIAKKVDEVETKNKLESGGKPEVDDDEDLSLEDFEDYPFDEDDDDQDGKTRDSRRYRYKLQKYWRNRRKNRRPYRQPYYHYYHKRW